MLMKRVSKRLFVFALLLPLARCTDPRSDAGCTFKWRAFGCTPRADCRLKFRPWFGALGPCIKRDADKQQAEAVRKEERARTAESKPFGKSQAEEAMEEAKALAKAAADAEAKRKKEEARAMEEAKALAKAAADAEAERKKEEARARAKARAVAKAEAEAEAKKRNQRMAIAATASLVVVALVFSRFHGTARQGAWTSEKVAVGGKPDEAEARSKGEETHLAKERKKKEQRAAAKRRAAEKRKAAWKAQAVQDALAEASSAWAAPAAAEARTKSTAAVDNELDQPEDARETSADDTKGTSATEKATASRGKYRKVFTLFRVGKVFGAIERRRSSKAIAPPAPEPAPPLTLPRLVPRSPLTSPLGRFEAAVIQALHAGPGGAHSFKVALQNMHPPPSMVSALRLTTMRLASEALTSNREFDVALVEGVVSTLIGLLHTTLLEARVATRDVLFFPSMESKARLVRLLKTAQLTCDVCVYTITDDEICDVLLSLHARGVKCRVISDDEQAITQKGSCVFRIAEAGIPTVVDEELSYKPRSPGRRSLHRVERNMHHKFALIDSSVLVTGSFNWTRARGCAQRGELPGHKRSGGRRRVCRGVRAPLEQLHRAPRALEPRGGCAHPGDPSR